MIGAALLAHQGGWDEALFVLAPLAVFAGLLMVARRRVDQMEDEAGDADAEVRHDAAPHDEDTHGTT